MTGPLTSEDSRAAVSMVVICLPVQSLPQILLMKIPARRGYSKTLLILLHFCVGKRQNKPLHREQK